MTRIHHNDKLEQMLYRAILKKYHATITNNPIISMKRNRHILLAMSFYHEALHKGVARFASEHGWHLNAKMTITGKVPLGWSGDGVIIQGPTSEEYREFINSLIIPKVCMGSWDWGCPNVIDDHEEIGKIAAEYYLTRGFKSFAVYTEFSGKIQRELKSFIHIITRLQTFLFRSSITPFQSIIPIYINNWMP